MYPEEEVEESSTDQTSQPESNTQMDEETYETKEKKVKKEAITTSGLELKRPDQTKGEMIKEKADQLEKKVLESERMEEDDKTYKSHIA